MRKIFIVGLFTLIGVYGQTTHAAVATSTKNIHDPVATEAKVRDYFKATPVMVEIARCESKFRQFTDSGAPLRSAGMIGIFQFYESIHAPIAKSRGLDLATIAGNLAYAKYLYDTEGMIPWNGSKYCWQTVDPTLVKPTTLSSKDRQKLLDQITTLQKLIVLLQKQLVAKQTLAKR
jgi:hypothetical protein